MATTANLCSILCCILQLFSLGVWGDGQYIVTHAPSYMKFEEKAGQITTSSIPKLLSSQYGFHSSKGLKWHGLKQTSMFKRPKASVVLSLEGVPQGITIPVEHVAKFDAKQDDATVDTEFVSNILRSANWEHEPVIVDFSGDNTVHDIRAANPTVLGDLTTSVEQVRELYKAGRNLIKPEFAGGLNVSHDTDFMLLAELQLIMETAHALKSKPEVTRDGSPDLYHFRIGGLGKIAAEYGQESQKVADALHLLHVYVKKLTEEFKQIYENNLVIQVVSLSPVDPTLVRKTRSLLATPTMAPPTLENELKVSADYSNDYPVAFNMVLWTSVIIVAALISISTAIWHMDPGRDSIIYRMTTQRIKKD